MRVYRALTATLAPLARRRLARQGRALDAVAGREAERRGEVPEAGGELWLHCASVGELNAAQPLIERLLDRAGRPLLVSTLTPTAAALAADRYRDHDRVRSVLAPLDRPADVRRWLDRTRPERLVLIETELWPELLAGCIRRALPFAIANARISDRAMGRYRRLRGLFAPLLAACGPIACQAPADAQRFEQLGAPAGRIVVTGNIKFDPAAPADLPADLERPLDALAMRPTWLAGSTHAGEEALVVEAHRRVLERHRDALLLLVPRHPERANEARAVAERAGLTVTGFDRPSTGGQVLLVDRLGVLAGLYGVSSVNFVGGSLVEGIGGHNLIEAARGGRPVLTGPHTADQAEAANGLEGAGGLVRVQGAADLAATIIELFDDPDRRAGIAHRAETFLATQRGALDRTVAVLERWLGGAGARPESSLN
ncbi:3-deoxy-D-manno-octulosonic acid transferase [Halomonas denitrificans]|nr:3-deoxy-D-manno-octulosonic acid transferase [Halomonas denitrificans]